MKIPTLEDFGVVRFETELEYGTKLILFKKENAPISINLVFYSGSLFDPAGKEGLAHFTEHMTVAGTKKFPTKDLLAIQLENLGGGFSASTGQDTFKIHINVVESEDIPQATDIMSEMLNESLFNPKTMENERGSILQELRGKDTPGKMVDELTRQLHGQGTPIARPGIGTEETIKSVTVDDVTEYYREMLSSGRCVVVAAGDVSLDHLKTCLDEGLKLRYSDKYRVVERFPIIRDKFIATKKYTINDQIHINFGFRTVDTFHEDATPLIFLGSILGGGGASRLERKLRYENGLVYSVGAGYGGISSGGSFGISTRVEKSKTQLALNIITNELKDIVTNGIKEEEIDFVKNRSLKSKKGSMQTAGSWVGFHSYDELFETGVTLTKYMESVAKLTSDDINRVARKYLCKDKWYLAMTGNIEEDDVFIDF